MMNRKGQALIETLGALPVFLGLCSFGSAVLHHLFVFYLSDHWNYQAAFCLAQEMKVSQCKKSLKAKLLLLPFTEIKEVDLRENHHFVSSQVKINLPYAKQLFLKEQFKLPLKNQDFRRAQ